MQQRILFSIGILSITIIAFQLVLMQILSIVQWYHFAYMIISVALLGFGAGGSFLSIFREWSLKHFEVLLPALMIFSGATMALVVGLSQNPSIRFDSYLLFTEFSHIGRLFFTYLLFFIPLFLGALAIGLVFVKLVDNIGMIYFANLLGSGIGGLVAIGLIWLFLPQQLPAILSLLSVMAGIIAMPDKFRIPIITIAILSMAIIAYAIFKPPKLVLSEFKSLSKTLDLPDAEITLSESSPYGLINLVAAPALRYAPGLSLNYTDTVPVRKALFDNGNWLGPLIPWKSSGSDFMMEYTTSALPYVMKRRERVLVLDAGTGEDVAHAVIQNAHEIKAVEPNQVVMSLLKNELASETDSLYFHPKVSIHNMASRTYLLTQTTQYDLINLPVVSAFGGTSGLNALQEQYLLTKEAFKEMWNQLNEEGVISISSWMDYPYRNPLKVLSTIVEMLAEQGIHHPGDYIAAIRSWGTITFVVKKSPLARAEVQRIRDFCEKMYFDPAILPGLKPGERTNYNALQDEQFFDHLESILSDERTAFYEAYDFNIRPATDNRPYFSQFIKWKSLPHLAELFGSQAVPFFEIGYLIVVITLIQIVIAAVLLIILPLFWIGWKGGYRGWTIFYFGGLGLGYMFVELILIQRFTLYFGNPIYAAAAVISFMLVCSGFGSYFSSRLKPERENFFLVLGIIISLLILYAIILTPILQNTISWNIGFKILLAFVIIAFPTFVMGIPFPIGLRFLSNRNQAVVPWAWGINGCLSVVSTALVTIVAVELGFTWVMGFASFAYSLPLIVNIRKI